MDHQCDKEAFPRVTTTILQMHEDEVWNIEWSHSGRYLASASKDKTAVIWKVGVCLCSFVLEWIDAHVLFSQTHPPIRETGPHIWSYGTTSIPSGAWRGH